MNAAPRKSLANRQGLAEALGCTIRTVANYERKGMIPFIRIGARTVRYDVDDVIAYLKRRSPR
jgi:DNA-binding transcriptional MerR regulator